MERSSMICLVHQNCLWIVVDRYINLPPQGHLDSNRSSAATGKAVNDQVVVPHCL
jgi:hypothetical protein